MALTTILQCPKNNFHSGHVTHYILGFAEYKQHMNSKAVFHTMCPGVLLITQEHSTLPSAYALEAHYVCSSASFWCWK